MPEGDGDSDSSKHSSPHTHEKRRSYGLREESLYKDSEKRFFFPKTREANDNYEQLSRELTALGHRADAEDMMETIHEIGYLRARSAFREKRRQDFIAHTVYTTLDQAIKAYRWKKITEKQFQDIFYRTQHQLSDALHVATPKELKKKINHSWRLTDIVNKEIGEQAAALLAFIFSLLSFDQARLTGMAVAATTSGYDYYSLFGFLFLALATLLFLMRKH